MSRRSSDRRDQLDGKSWSVSLIRSTFRRWAVDAGPLARGHELEALGYLHMALQEPLGTGFGSAVKFVG